MPKDEAWTSSDYAEGNVHLPELLRGLYGAARSTQTKIKVATMASGIDLS